MTHDSAFRSYIHWRHLQRPNIRKKFKTSNLYKEVQ